MVNEYIKTSCGKLIEIERMNLFGKTKSEEYLIKNFIKQNSYSICNYRTYKKIAIGQDVADVDIYENLLGKIKLSVCPYKLKYKEMEVQLEVVIKNWDTDNINKVLSLCNELIEEYKKYKNDIYFSNAMYLLEIIIEVLSDKKNVDMFLIDELLRYVDVFLPNMDTILIHFIFYCCFVKTGNLTQLMKLEPALAKNDKQLVKYDYHSYLLAIRKTEQAMNINKELQKLYHNNIKKYLELKIVEVSTYYQISKDNDDFYNKVEIILKNADLSIKETNELWFEVFACMLINGEIKYAYIVLENHLEIELLSDEQRKCALIIGAYVNSDKYMKQVSLIDVEKLKLYNPDDFILNYLRNKNDEAMEAEKRETFLCDYLKLAQEMQLKLSKWIYLIFKSEFRDCIKETKHYKSYYDFF